LPLQLAFQVPRPAPEELFQMPVMQVVLQYMIDIVFMTDILLCFRTTILGRAEEGSQVITDTRTIMKAYTNWPRIHRGKFLWDFLACVPFDICAAGATGGILGVTGSYLRLNRLLHAWRIVSVHGGQIQRQKRMTRSWCTASSGCSCATSPRAAGGPLASPTST